MTPRKVERDHVDEFLESLDVPGIDLSVEGIVDRIMGLARRLRRTLDETLSEVGLNQGEWGVLSMLHHAGSPHRRSPGLLAARAELSSGAMTNRLDQLERAGFVRRLPDPSDRRGIQVELTRDGLAMWQRAAAVQAGKESIISSALTARERERLNVLLRRIMIAFERTEAAR
jgi:DNA-binding MarR family transcriptional regulator